MKPITKKLAAALVAAATLFGGIAITNSAMAAEGDAPAVTKPDVTKLQSLTVTDTTGKGALTGKTLYAVPLALYTDQFSYVENATVDGDTTQTDKTLITSYTVSTYDGKDKSSANPKVADSDFVRVIHDAANQQDVKSSVNDKDDKSTLTDADPMQWVVENLLDSDKADAPAVSYKGNLRNFLIHLRDAFNSANSGTSPVDYINKYGSKLQIAQDGNTAFTGAESATSAQNTLTPGIYVVFDVTASTAATGDKIQSIEMMTGTKLDGHDFGVVKTPAKGDTPATYTRMPKGEIEYKPVQPVIDKNIVETTDDGNGNTTETRTKANEVAVNDLVRYELTTYVPNYTGYKTYYLEMHDVLSKGLTYYESSEASDAHNMKVTIAPRLKDNEGKAQYATEAKDGFRTLTAMTDTANDNDTADYNVTTGNYNNTQDTSDPYNGGKKIDIMFGVTKHIQNNVAAYTSDVTGTDANAQPKFPVGAKITVTYYARLNKDAVIAGAGNPNKVNLEYSNAPRSDGHGTTENHQVKTYTGAFNLHKVDAVGSNLKDAKFKVYSGEKIETKTEGSNTVETNLVEFVAVNKTVGEQNVLDYYRPALPDDPAANKVSELTVPESGVLPFKGLDGTYFLKETYSPLKGSTSDGTAKDPKVNFTVTITMDKYKGTDAEVTNGSASAGDYKSTYTVSSTDNTNNGLVTAESSATANKLTTDAEHTVRVMNVKNFLEMPKTGQTWLIIYGVVALMFVACGAVLLSTGKKSAAHKGQKA